MKSTLSVMAVSALSLNVYGQLVDNNEEEIAYQRAIDSIENSFQYQRGTISLEGDLATLRVPKGYKFLDAEQSQHLLTNLWGNPPSEVAGMLFPEDITPLSDNFTYAVEIYYSEEGYIDDEDAADINYDDLLEEMQDDARASNTQRTAQGYPTIDLIGWAAPPYYDAEQKKLHWAKELSFENSAEHTLNYNIRVLGRKGYLNLNAIGDMDVLPTFRQDADNILASVTFNEGNRYSDFNPDVDKIAAYGIGGLIAGKVLAKVGFFAVLLKFWKVIAIAAVGLFGALRKVVFSSAKTKQS